MFVHVGTNITITIKWEKNHFVNRTKSPLNCHKIFILMRRTPLLLHAERQIQGCKQRYLKPRGHPLPPPTQPICPCRPPRPSPVESRPNNQASTSHSPLLIARSLYRCLSPFPSPSRFPFFQPLPSPFSSPYTFSPSVNLLSVSLSPCLSLYLCSSANSRDRSLLGKSNSDYETA